MKIERTSRGVVEAIFLDAEDQSCYIAESFSGGMPHIWVGGESRESMHLSREHVTILLPLLQRFVATGTIGLDPDASPEPTDWRQVAIDLDRDNAKLAAEVKDQQQIIAGLEQRLSRAHRVQDGMSAKDGRVTGRNRHTARRPEVQRRPYA